MFTQNVRLFISIIFINLIDEATVMLKDKILSFLIAIFPSELEAFTAKCLSNRKSILAILFNLYTLLIFG